MADRTAGAARFHPANSNLAGRSEPLPPGWNEPGAGELPTAHDEQELSNFDAAPISPAADTNAPQPVPAIAAEAGAATPSFIGRLGRSGFALSVLLHATMAVALGLTVLPEVEPPAAIEGGVVLVSFEGNESPDADAKGGETEAEERPEEKVVPQPVMKEAEPEPAFEAAPAKEPVAQTESVTDKVLASANHSSWKIDQPVEPREIPKKPAETPLKALPVAKPEVTEKQPEADVAEKPAIAEREISKAAETHKPVTLDVTKRVPEAKPEKLPEPKLRKSEDAAKTPKRTVSKEPRKTTAKPAIKGIKGKAETTSRSGDRDAPKARNASRQKSQGKVTSSEAGNAARSNYKGLVQKKLQRAKARVRKPADGSVTVRFTISANGAVSGLSVVSSSGNRAVDKAAMEIVRKASPFPAIPAETGKSSWTMSVPVTFR